MTTTTVGPQVHLWWEMWERARAHLVRACAAAISAKVAERQVRLAEQAGERAGLWLREVLAVLNPSEAQMQLVMSEAVRHLHILDGGKAA